MEFEVLDNDLGKRLDVFLQEKFPNFSRSHIQNSIKKEDSYILRNCKKLTKAGETIKKGDQIFSVVNPPKEVEIRPEKVEFEIVYQDEDLAVINKPQGVVVHPCSSCPGGTLVNGLVLQLDDLSGINGELRPGIVHRIDKNTCGLLLIAKNDFAHVEIAKQLESKTCHREYRAIVMGNITHDSGRIDAPIGRDSRDRQKMTVTDKGSRDARTHFEVLERFGNSTYVECSLETVRTHQIRVHMKYINHPVMGDEKYGKKCAYMDTEGQVLHAYKISFIHPRTKEKMTFTAPLPDYFNKLLDILRKERDK